MAFFFYTSLPLIIFFFFFFNDTATTEIYTLSLHDALPIFDEVLTRMGDEVRLVQGRGVKHRVDPFHASANRAEAWKGSTRSEEHTSELQSHSDLVCRLLLEKKKKKARLQLRARAEVHGRAN